MPRYEFTDGSSNKFWEITLDDASFVTRWGKIGAAPTEQKKTFGSRAEAKEAYGKLCVEKVKKGYVRVDDAPAAPPASAAHRYVCGEGATAKFWEIEDTGETSFVVRYGTVGKPATEGAKKFADAGAKRKAWDKQVAERLTRGYELVEAGAPPSPAAAAAPHVSKRHVELEAAILANPDDAASYLVYADALQADGDPLGELIALAAAGKGGKLKKDLEARLLPGLVARAVEGGALQLEWKLGFVRRAVYSTPSYDYEQEETDGEIVAALLDAPVGRFLMTLEIGNLRADGNVDCQPVVDALAAHPRPALRKLVLAEYEQDQCELDWGSAGELAALWKQTPNLVELKLRSGKEMTTGVLDLPKLTKLSIVTGGLRAANIRDLGKSHLPSLETADIYLGSDSYGGDGKAKDLDGIFDGKNLPKLKRLGLMNCGFIDDVCASLHTAKILKRLDALDLSMGTMSRAGAQALIDHADAYRHLALSVGENYVPDELCAELIKKISKKVDVGGQREGDGEEDEYRYTVVGE